MPDHSRNKGPWIHRFLTILFSAIFAILSFWLTGFVVDDIGTWPGPVYKELEDRRLDRDIVKQAEALQRQIADTQRRIVDQKARQELLRDSTANSQTTMNQLLEFQRSSLEKNIWSLGAVLIGELIVWEYPVTFTWTVERYFP